MLQFLEKCMEFSNFFFTFAKYNLSYLTIKLEN